MRLAQIGRLLILIGLLLLLAGPMIAVSQAAPLEGQGGSANTGSDNTTLFIVGGLVVVVLVAGVGLVLSRRKK